MTAFGTWNAIMIVSFSSLDTLIWAMTMMKSTQNKNRTQIDTVSAIECSLWICFNTYTTAVNNDILTETIQRAPLKINPHSWQLINKSKELNLDSSSRDELFTPRTAIAHFSHHGFARRTDLRLGEGFNISQAAAYSIANSLREIFASGGDDRGAAINAFVSRSDESSDDSLYYQPSAMQGLYNSQDLEATFATLAESMTNNIRQNSDNETVINGKEGKYVIVIRVREWFLTLPVILIVGSIIFLALVLHYIHTAGIEFWGTNVLPIVALGGKTGSIFDETDMRASTMERDAKRQLVQFPIIQLHRGLNRADTLDRSENHDENHEMISPFHVSAIHNPSVDAESIVLPLRNSMIHSPSVDAESIISPTRGSVISSLSADMEGIISPSRASVIQSPPADVVSILSPTRESVTHGPASPESNDA